MRKLCILVIEGDPCVRDNIARTLRARFGGDAVATADTLGAALHEDLPRFDLVFTEWLLPDTRGPAVVEALTDAGARPVVVITDAHLGMAAQDAVLAGASDFVARAGDYLATLPLVVEKNLAFEQLRRERDALNRQLTEQNETLEALLKSLSEAASTDHLTNLFNRRSFARELDRAFHDALRGGHDLACVMLDLDRFKQLNDTFGHQAGDDAIVLASRVIKDNLRRSDIAARYGGDEFVLLLPRSSPLEAVHVARRIREAFIAELNARGYTDPGFGMSFGVASLLTPDPLQSHAPDTPDRLVANADEALYRYKRARRQPAPLELVALTPAEARMAS